ncbi:hypothetical protein KGA65_15910 [Ideonella sp. B7]|uniref:hypothetical protein n=1 Tax=Ideonella benzenivorans TaxID=2831643 RepID=UPI001CED4D0F|nr:hypothetical protein [Ideonella benzenivorans]MCA6218020.1 hypothetical protein [Ideonella benzenivorans]
MTTFFAPSTYENPLTAGGRARTVAAFHLAQGNVDTLTNADMRRDILNVLMSPRAVGYWLNDKKWLELVRKVGRVKIVRLTDAGLRTCANSIAGGSEVPTTPELVQTRRIQMLQGSHGHTPKSFAPLAE